MNGNPVGKATVVLLLFSAFVLGAFLSYLWIVGYYLSLELKVPERTTVTISEVTFSPQDPSYFNVSVLNPSFSPENAKILQILILTEDKVIHEITRTFPVIPVEGYVLLKGENVTFKCYWDWAVQAGKELKVIVSLAEGSGAAFTVNLPRVNLNVTRFVLDPTKGDRFNITVYNSQLSATYVNISRIEVKYENQSEEISLITPPLPYRLDPGDSVNFLCSWSWTDHQGENITIAVGTVEGYTTQEKETIQTYVELELTEVTFNATDTTHFNVTITNKESSLISVNIIKIAVILQGETHQIIGVTTVNNASLPYELDKNSSEIFICPWGWGTYPGEDIRVVIYTLEGYTASKECKIPSI